MNYLSQVTFCGAVWSHAIESVTPEAIVAQATERRVADRISTAGRLADYLQLYLEGKPLPIRPPTFADLARRWARQHRSGLRFAAALLLGDRLTPCPVCRKPGTRLGALDRQGRCYGGCGRLTLGRLLDAFLRPQAGRGED